MFDEGPRGEAIAIPWRGGKIVGRTVKVHVYFAILCAIGLFVVCCDWTRADDVSAIGAGVDNYVNGAMDNSYVWYEQGFNPNAPTTGLPAAGVIPSATSPNWSFRLQPYNGNNVLLLNAASPIGSMNLSAATPLSRLGIAVTTGLGPATFVATIHFADATPDYVSSPITDDDWFHGTPQTLVTGSGRITTFEYTDFFGVHRVAGEFNVVGSGVPIIHIQTITLPANLTSHPIASVSFDLTLTTHGADPYLTNTAIFGLSASTDNGVSYAPLDLTTSSFTNDVVVEAAALPEPSGFLFLISAGVIGRRQRVTP
jgi:hypothetical protein